jgi:hypothetical protein
VYKGEISAGLRKANSAALLKDGKKLQTPSAVSAGDYYKNFKQGFKGYKPPAPPEGAVASGAAEGTAAAAKAEKTVTGSAPMQKRAGINTMHDAHRAIGGRPPYALLTMGGETSNDAVINQMLRALFANTDAMRKATEDQVLAAFPLSAPYSYGRHRAIGRTADDIKAEIALAYTPTQR